MNNSNHDTMVELTGAEVDAVSGGVLLLGTALYLGAVFAWAVAADADFRRRYMLPPRT
ncbi:MAG TPA: hypothetical protein VIT62_13505 [Lysobacter sp.]